MKFFHEQKEYKGGLRVLTLKRELNSYPAHWHMEHEILAVLSGTLNVGFNLRNYTLNAGELIFIPGGNIHYFDTAEDGEECCMMFSPTILNEELNGFSKPLIIRCETGIDYFVKIFNYIDREIEKCDTAYVEFTEAYLKLISAWLTRFHKPDDVIVSKNINPAELNKIKDLLEYIEKNYSRKISVDTGADMLHFSKSYFCKYFKILSGTTFSKYINSIRIDAAKNMLKTTDYKITEIANICGFENIRTFNREFKATTGLTAKEYRTSNLL